MVFLVILTAYSFSFTAVYWVPAMCKGQEWTSRRQDCCGCVQTRPSCQRRGRSPVGKWFSPQIAGKSGSPASPVIFLELFHVALLCWKAVSIEETSCPCHDFCWRYRASAPQHCPCRHLFRGNLHGAASMASPPKLTCENQLGTLLLPSALAVQRLPAHCSQEPFRGAEWHVLNDLGSHCVVCPWACDLIPNRNPPGINPLRLIDPVSENRWKGLVHSHSPSFSSLALFWQVFLMNCCISSASRWPGEADMHSYSRRVADTTCAFQEGSPGTTSVLCLILNVLFQMHLILFWKC